jgi:CheY-like chemotaxis protein
LKNLLVLATDDENEILQILDEALVENLGFIVQKSPSAQHSLNMIKRSKYDLLITDFRMPEMNGGDFIRAVRAEDSENKNTPLILLSAYLQEAKEDTEGIPNLFYLDKPILLTKLFTCIEDVLGICSFCYKPEDN